jgi:bacteriocin-like protein
MPQPTSTFSDDSTLDDPHPSMSEMAETETAELTETELASVAGGGLGWNHNQSIAL